MSADKDVATAYLRAWADDIDASFLRARVAALLRRAKHRHGGIGVADARERRTRTAMRRLERRARRRARNERRWLERSIARHGVIESLACLVRRAGLTPTLYGRPVDAKQLRAAAEFRAGMRFGPCLRVRR